MAKTQRERELRKCCRIRDELQSVASARVQSMQSLLWWSKGEVDEAEGGSEIDQE